MSDVPSPESSDRWWLSIGGETHGPFSASDLTDRLASGELSPAAYVCAVGQSDWKRIADTPQFRQESNEAPLPPPPPDAKPISAPPVPSTVPVDAIVHSNAWSPLVIALAGVLFTPIWSGIMAAINARRVGIEQPAWRPLAIGVGSQLIAIIFGCAGFDMGFFFNELIFTVAPLVALWNLDLNPQQTAYEQLGETTAGNWAIPMLAGSPLALLTILHWGILLFAPLEPAEVVQRFMDSDTADEARQYCTPSMYGLVDGVMELEKLDGGASVNAGVEFELLDEFYGEFSDDEYRVDYRMKIPADDGNPAQTLKGYVYLKWVDSRWRVDDWIVTASSQFPGGMEPVSFSVIIDAALRDARLNAQKTPPASGSNPLANLWETIRKHPHFLIGVFIAVAAMAKALGIKF